MDDLINRQAAIDYCYALINAENPSDPHDEWNYSQERINQTEVILHHLEFMPSAHPESAKRTEKSEQNVSDGDLISRKAAIDAVGSMLRRKFGVGGDLAEITIAELPPAQPDVSDINVGGMVSRRATEALDRFTKIYCRDETIEHDLVFRCKECVFHEDNGMCLIKVMARKLCPDYKDFGCMGDL